MKARSLSPRLVLLLLATLWSVDSLRNDLFPQVPAITSPWLAQAALYGVFAAIAAGICAARGIGFPRGRQMWANAAAGLGLFVVPAGLGAAAQGWVSRLDQVAVFSLTPIFASVLEPHLAEGSSRPARNALVAALTAMAGILLLFPLDLPGSARSGIALCALMAAAVSIAAANCLAVRLAGGTAGSILPMAAQASGASATCFAIAAMVRERHAGAEAVALLWPLLTGGPALFILFWLMPRMAASRMTARFVLAPLFSIAGGLLLEPARVPGRALFGLFLLAVGAGWLVFAPVAERDEEAPESLKVLPR